MEIKKSAVDLTDLAIGIVVLGIVVTIGSVILINLRDSQLTSANVVTTNNETIAPTTAGTNLANKWGKQVLTVYNVTGGSVASSNYAVTISSVDGTMKVANLTNISPGNWNVTYNWYNTSSTASWTTADKAAGGLGEYGSWFKIITIVGIAAVVLGLIFLAFGKNQSGGVSY